MTPSARDRTGRKPTLVDEAEGALREWLLPGHRRRGDRLPPEHELARQLGISRGTLRTALERLERTGEVVRRQGSGTFVGEIGDLRPFSEGLERLAPYSALARARGMSLLARDIEIEERPVGRDLGLILDVEPERRAPVISRVVVVDGAPAAFMVDIVHPDAPLPALRKLVRALERGRMVLDVLLDADVPIAYSRTRISARLIGPGDAVGSALEVSRDTAALELDETVHARGGGVVLRSSDVFSPGGLDLHVIRHLETGSPGPVPRSPAPGG